MSTCMEICMKCHIITQTSLFYGNETVHQELSITWTMEKQVTGGGEPWILALNVEENVLLLAADADLLLLLHQSDCWVVDGSFDYQPPASSQLYTIRGFYNGECKAAVSVLMPDHHLETYSLVLTTIRQALIDRHHSIGDIEGKLTS